MGALLEREIRPRNRLGIKDVARELLATKPAHPDLAREIIDDLPRTPLQSFMGELIGRPAVAGFMVKEYFGPDEDYMERLIIGLRNGYTVYKLEFSSVDGRMTKALDIDVEEISETPRHAYGRRFRDRSDSRLPYTQEEPLLLEGAFGGKFESGSEFDSFIEGLRAAKYDTELTQSMFEVTNNAPRYGSDRNIDWARPRRHLAS